MQGRLREGEGLTFDIQSECAQTHRPLRFEMDGVMNYRLEDTDARPLVFMPDLDWDHFEEPNIIHAY